MTSGRNGEIRIDGKQLKNTRLDRKLSRSFLSKEIDSTEAVIIRAESKGLIRLEKLERVCKVLEIPPERLEFQPIPAIAGEWLGLFVESDVSRVPYVALEEITFSTDSSGVHGKMTVHTPNGEIRTEFVENVRFYKQQMYGNTRMEGVKIPSGFASFVYTLLASDSRLVGYTVWSADNFEVQQSKALAVKKGSQFFEQDFAGIANRMFVELALHRVRSALDRGLNVVQMIESARHELEDSADAFTKFLAGKTGINIEIKFNPSDFQSISH